MKVQGTEISEDIIEQALAALPSGNSFIAIELITRLLRLGVPAENDVAMRCADRVLQRERKAGRIEFGDSYWRFIS